MLNVSGLFLSPPIETPPCLPWNRVLLEDDTLADELVRHVDLTALPETKILHFVANVDHPHKCILADWLVYMA